MVLPHPHLQIHLAEQRPRSFVRSAQISLLNPETLNHAERRDTSNFFNSLLGLFLHNGRIELDNNTVERAIRPIALGRKNHLFAGSDGGAAHWATVASLIATAKLNEVEPFAYLRDVLERMSNGHSMSRLDELLPWNWTQLKAAA